MTEGRRIGALWTTKKDSKSKLSGEIEFLGVPFQVAIFPNDKKTKANEPAYVIVGYGFKKSIEVSRQPGEDMPF